MGFTIVSNRKWKIRKLVSFQDSVKYNFSCKIQSIQNVDEYSKYIQQTPINGAIRNQFCDGMISNVIMKFERYTRCYYWTVVLTEHSEKKIIPSNLLPFLICNFDSFKKYF